MTTHIILKYKNPRIGNESIDTILEHEKVLREFGYVDFGVLGKGVSIERAGLLQEQIKRGLKTDLYLVSSATTGLKTFRCSFDGITKEPRNNLRHPSYYKDLGEIISWIRILSIVELDNSVLSELVTISTDRIALDSLSKGMASTLFVRERK